MSTFFAVDGMTFGITKDKVLGCRRLVLSMLVMGTEVQVFRIVGMVTLVPSHRASAASFSPLSFS